MIRHALAALVCAAALPVLAQSGEPAPRSVSEADSLLDAVITDLGYDRFLAKSFGQGDPFGAFEVRDRGRLRAVWAETFTQSWYAAQVRAEFLDRVTLPEVRAMAAWARDPVVRRAVRHDYSSTGGRPGADVRLRRALVRGTLEPRFEAAVRRIADAAGSGRSGLEWEAMRMVALVEYQAAALPAEERPTRDEIEDRARWVVEDLAPEMAEDFVVFVATRFEGYPVDELEHYAEALETPAGQTYLRLVVDAPSAAMHAAVVQTLGRTEG